MFVELLLDILGQKAGTKIDVSDADARFLMDGGKARAVAGDPLADAVGKSISDVMGKITGGLQTAVDAALKEFAAAQAKSRKSRVPEILGDGQAGDTQRSFGRFLLAVRHNDRKALEEMGSRRQPHRPSRSRACARPPAPPRLCGRWRSALRPAGPGRPGGPTLRRTASPRHAPRAHARVRPRRASSRAAPAGA